MRLTDFFLSFPERASGENIVQTANRISGTYAGQPTLRVWTSKHEWSQVARKQDEIDAIYLLLSQNPTQAPTHRLDRVRRQVCYVPSQEAAVLALSGIARRGDSKVSSALIHHLKTESLWSVRRPIVIALAKLEEHN